MSDNDDARRKLLARRERDGVEAEAGFGPPSAMGLGELDAGTRDVLRACMRDVDAEVDRLIRTLLDAGEAAGKLSDCCPPAEPSEESKK